MTRFLTIVGLSLLATLELSARATQHPAMPPGMTHGEHQAQMERDAAMKRRGADAMGFDQDATVHHFVLKPTGGLIEVQAKDPADAASRAAIRSHLAAIAGEFARGDFAKPLMTHAENPPGVETMKRLKGEIRFAFEEMPAGGRVTIDTADRAALGAVHEFLRYQIREHATMDSLEVRKY